jgi:hypothetical protein
MRTFKIVTVALAVLCIVSIGYGVMKERKDQSISMTDLCAVVPDHCPEWVDDDLYTVDHDVYASMVATDAQTSDEPTFFCIHASEEMAKIAFRRVEQ